MDISKDFKEFIKLLNVHKVSYLVVGGYAVNFHGYPRFTKDIDIWIWMKQKNIQKLIKVIKEFGFESLNLNEEDFMNPENIIQLGVAPNRIDLLVDLEGVDFQNCFKKRKEIEIDDLSVNFISLHDLIRVKKTTGRLQDLADAEQLEKIKEHQKNNF